MRSNIAILKNQLQLYTPNEQMKIINFKINE